MNSEGRAKHYRALVAENSEGRAKRYRALVTENSEGRAKELVRVQSEMTPI
ncbi:MAG: hypothetical protein J6R26_01290 [Paludibacteraceae bacterium]|nr:hypothetical protein [Paludibacteraceae bacterium]